MTREEKSNLLNELLEYEEKNDIGNLTRAERREFQQWVSKALEQEPTTKNDLGVDCISRQAVEDAMYDATRSLDLNYGQIMEYIDNLPSVTPQLSVPEVTALAEWTTKLTKECEEAYNKGYADGMKAQEPKTGEWIEHFDESGKWYECDQCHTDWGGAVNFCPNCGAKMAESEVDNGNDD